MPSASGAQSDHLRLKLTPTCNKEACKQQYHLPVAVIPTCRCEDHDAPPGMLCTNVS
ncbi:hypothetical protein RvY_02871 [Ramazzottius varieornatus]|uniref:Uncharacterized protein n=1 Tax=Ramazzottius varieornatus TaxID=947166 RepID=A0A1D1UPL8_RAMVA|nr:hypothetical protein RvY_02871 [Ramazzottius varieornatus]